MKGKKKRKKKTKTQKNNNDITTNYMPKMIFRVRA